MSSSSTTVAAKTSTAVVRMSDHVDEGIGLRMGGNGAGNGAGGGGGGGTTVTIRNGSVSLQ